MTAPTDTPLKKKSKIPWYVYFVGGILYSIFAIWLFGWIGLPGMDFYHQCAVGILLCLGSLETRKTKQR